MSPRLLASKPDELSVALWELGLIEERHQSLVLSAAIDLVYQKRDEFLVLLRERQEAGS